MKGVVVVDTNLLVLLVVGSASKDCISRHKRLDDYRIYDFELLGLIISEFSDIVLLPHILAEVSNLVRHAEKTAQAGIHSALAELVLTCAEYPAPSISAVQREEFGRLGLTDAVILDLCTMDINGVSPTLLTSDTPLADVALSLGHSVIDYRREYLAVQR